MKSLNQYDLVLAMTAWIRKNSDDPRVSELKRCKCQSEQMALFKTIIA